MTLTHVCNYAHKLQCPLHSDHTAELAKASGWTKTQVADWLLKRRPPLSDDQIKAVLAEFDKP